MIEIRNVLLKATIYYSTFGYVLFSLAGAHFPELTFSLTILRDCWMLPAVLLVVFEKQYQLLLFICTTLLISAVGVLIDVRLFDPIVFAYGFRDIIFLATVAVLLKIDPHRFGSDGLMKLFVFSCLGLSILELFLQAAGRNDLVDTFFQYRQYFDGKGVVSNISGGVWGNRLVAPMYSASLVGVLYALYAFFSARNIWSRGAAFTVAIFSLSKVIPIIAFYGLMKRYAKISSLLLILIIIAIYPLFSYLIDNFSMTIYSQHASSIIDRYNAFTIIFVEQLSFRPWPLGYWSVYGHLMAGLEVAEAPESLLIARFLDLGALAIVPFSFLVLSCRSINTHYQAFIILFFTLQLLSSLNNHLVAFVPIIVLIKIARVVAVSRVKSRNTEEALDLGLVKQILRRRL